MLVILNGGYKFSFVKKQSVLKQWIIKKYDYYSILQNGIEEYCEFQ